MVEIVLAMVLVAMLTALVTMTYSGVSRDTHHKVNRDRLSRIRQAIDTWQLERQRPWFQPSPPPGAPLDPWNRPYRVDPTQGLIWSRGPEGEGSSAPEDTSMSMPYKPMSLRPKGRPLAQASSASGGIEVAWKWPGGEAAPIGYRVLRSEDPAAGFQEAGTKDPTPPLRYLDPAVPAGKLVYYQVEAILGPGDQGSGPPPRSLPVSALRVVDGPPILSLESASSGVAAGQAALFHIQGSGNGSPLASLVFQGNAQLVGPGSCQLALSHVFPTAGPATVTATLVDTAGRATTATLDVQVY